MATSSTQKLIDFMGDSAVWETMVPGVEIRYRPALRHVPTRPTAYFVDSHWTARKAGDTADFNPWDHYQEPNTHGFCQTFSMMYLLDSLPISNYNSEAFQFAIKIVNDLPEDHPGFLIDPKHVLKRSRLSI